jgi:hypothetical protein
VSRLDPHGFDPDGQGSRSWMELVLFSFWVAMVVTRLAVLRGGRAGRPSA